MMTKFILDHLPEFIVATLIVVSGVWMFFWYPKGRR